MSSETQFINRQKASWCVSKWWEAGDCSLYKWVQNMIKRNCRALRKSNVLTIITLTLAHSLVWSCSESVPIICELCGRFCTWYALGVGLWSILEFLINSTIKVKGLCAPREVWQRDNKTRVLIWKCQLLLSAWQRRFTHSSCLESCGSKGTKRQEADSGQCFREQQQLKQVMGSYLHTNKKRQRLNRRCPLFHPLSKCSDVPYWSFTHFLSTALMQSHLGQASWKGSIQAKLSVYKCGPSTSSQDETASCKTLQSASSFSFDSAESMLQTSICWEQCGQLARCCHRNCSQNWADGACWHQAL